MKASEGVIYGLLGSKLTLRITQQRQLAVSEDLFSLQSWTSALHQTTWKVFSSNLTAIVHFSCSDFVQSLGDARCPLYSRPQTKWGNIFTWKFWTSNRNFWNKSNFVVVGFPVSEATNFAAWRIASVWFLLFVARKANICIHAFHKASRQSFEESVKDKPWGSILLFYHSAPRQKKKKNVFFPDLFREGPGWCVRLQTNQVSLHGALIFTAWRLPCDK